MYVHVMAKEEKTSDEALAEVKRLAEELHKKTEEERDRLNRGGQ